MLLATDEGNPMNPIQKSLNEQQADRFLANLEGPIPKKSISVFEPYMVETIIDVGSRGGSVDRMALMCGISPSTLRLWANKSNPEAIPAIVEAVELGRAMALVYYEEIGLMAANGILKNHASSTYQFLMKNLFRERYKDESTVKHDGKVKVAISADMDPVLAAQRYREMLSAENEPSFDDFLGDV